MKSPLFSIVTVTLNRADDAEATARNVLAQDFQDYEYIVKDGGSTDLTLQRLDDLGIAAHSSPDSGIYDAMNQALELCTGRYICFLNAGDLFADNSVLSTVAAHAAQQGYPQFLYGDVLSYENVKGDSPRLIVYRDRLSRFYLFRRVICHQAWFVDRSLYQKLNGFDEKFSISSAYDAQLRLLLDPTTNYYHVPHPVTIYQGGGASSGNTPQIREQRRLILRRNFGMAEYLLYQMGFTTLHSVAAVVKPFVLQWLPARLKGRFLGS